MSVPASEHSLNFVLVHGAWHGGWCWKRVSSLLRALGHEVFTPTLTGLGERQHLMSPEVGLDTHIKEASSYPASFRRRRLASPPRRTLHGFVRGSMRIRSKPNSTPFG